MRKRDSPSARIVLLSQPDQALENSPLDFFSNDIPARPVIDLHD